MSWDVSLSDENGPVKVERHFEGGTRDLYGETTADLNVTYNYSPLFNQALGEGFVNALNRKCASDCLLKLKKAIAVLGTEQDDDYWKPTPGNAGHALQILLGWARANPDAVFHVE